MVRSFYEMVIQRKQAANISTHIPEPLRHFNFTCDDDEEYSIPLKDMPKISPSIALAPVSSSMEPEDSLIMGNEELSTIPEKESDEFIKSSVENLIPIPRESEDTSGSDSESFDYLLEEFSGELAHIDPIPLGIEKADFDLEEEIRFVENLLYDNSSPRPPKELNLEIPDTILSPLTPTLILVRNSDSLMRRSIISCLPMT
ncbi:hypothetical protein Tco_0566861 [Tanacetum coccineum]